MINAVPWKEMDSAASAHFPPAETYIIITETNPWHDVQINWEYAKL